MCECVCWRTSTKKIPNICFGLSLSIWKSISLKWSVANVYRRKVLEGCEIFKNSCTFKKDRTERTEKKPKWPINIDYIQVHLIRFFFNQKNDLKLFSLFKIEWQIAKINFNQFLLNKLFKNLTNSISDSHNGYKSSK